MAMSRSLRAALLAVLLAYAAATYTGTFSSTVGPDFYNPTSAYGSGVPAQSYIKLTGRCVCAMRTICLRGAAGRSSVWVGAPLCWALHPCCRSAGVRRAWRAGGRHTGNMPVAQLG